MGANHVFVRGSEQGCTTSSNARSVDDCSPRGLNLQRKASATNVRQLKVLQTEDDQDFGYQKVDGSFATVKVGKKMVARLNPGDPDLKKGEPASCNTDQTAMMDDYRLKTGLVGGQLVRGHLLNRWLGGPAKNSNLYPITDNANNAHSYYVEEDVKKLVLSQKRSVQYEVEAGPDLGEPCSTWCKKSRFMCQYETIDGGQPIKKTITILSDVNGKEWQGRGGAWDVDQNKWLRKIPGQD